MVIEEKKIQSSGNIIYAEKTWLVRRWMYLVLVPVFFITIVLLYTNNMVEYNFVYYILAAFLILTLFSRLNLNITNDGSFHYTFFPFKFWNTSIQKEDILNIQIERNFKEFLGYGIRLSRKYSIAYVVDTKFLLIITTKKDKKIALSVNNKEEISRIVNGLGIAIKEEV